MTREALNASLLTSVADYYSSKLRAHGTTPQGVDWNSDVSQRLRFSRLIGVISASQGVSVNDIGCGYGALFDYLKEQTVEFRYCGVDVSPDMVAAARQLHAVDSRFNVTVGATCPNVADYTLASGVFNVRLNADEETWLRHVYVTLEHMDAVSTRGFAFNCLTKYSDSALMRPDLFYADPCILFDRCKRIYSRNVALLHDYGLFEFTILVRKDL